MPPLAHQKNTRHSVSDNFEQVQENSLHVIFHGIILMGVPRLHILPLMSPHYKNSLLTENIPILLDGIPLQHV